MGRFDDNEFAIQLEQEAAILAAFPYKESHIYDFFETGDYTGTVRFFYIESFKGTRTKHLMAYSYFINGVSVKREELYALSTKQGVMYNG